MTKEETINHLKDILAEATETEHAVCYVTNEDAEALEMAIEALKQPEQKTGKWIFKNDLKQFFCSECGAPSLTYDDVYIYSMDLPNFCEDCGADMREGGER